MVNDCYAHNGANKKIQLIDHHGCPIDEKLISRFQGTWGMTDNMYDTLIYAHMKTFRFTGTPALYIECDIRMCHGKCPVSSKVAHFSFLVFNNSTCSDFLFMSEKSRNEYTRRIVQTNSTTFLLI